MRDRIPTKLLDNGAVRYGVYDENGALLRYEYIKPEDEPTDNGTALNKANIMPDGVEAAIWGEVSDKTIGDAFGKMSELYQHWWSILHGQAYSYYGEVKTKLTSAVNLYSRVSKMTYSKNININADGTIELVDPVSIVIGYADSTNVTKFMKTLVDNAPVYVCNYTTEKTSLIYYVPAGATYSYEDATSTNIKKSTNTILGECDDETIFIYFPAESVPSERVASTVSAQLIEVPAGETTFEHSTDRNAYPDSGTVNGLTYKYLGVPFDNAKVVPKIEFGSYVGAGKYGNASYNTLTFSFPPKLLIMLGYKNGSNWSPVFRASNSNKCFSMFTEYFTESFQQNMGSWSNGTYQGYGKKSADGKTISWYSSESASMQLNETYTYHYVAIG